MLQDATRRWRSSKATKQTRTRRCKIFKCCKMVLEDEGDETRPRRCKYPTPPCALAKILPETTLLSSNRECFAHYKHVSYFFNRYSLSLYVYTRGLLGCPLGLWPLGQNPAEATHLTSGKKISRAFRKQGVGFKRSLAISAFGEHRYGHRPQVGRE